MAKTNQLIVKGISISTFKIANESDISLMDAARNKNSNEPKDVVKNWMHSPTPIKYWCLLERLNNSNFKGVEFVSFPFFDKICLA